MLEARRIDHMLYIILYPVLSEVPDNQHSRNMLNKGMRRRIHNET